MSSRSRAGHAKLRLFSNDDDGAVQIASNDVSIKTNRRLMRRLGLGAAVIGLSIALAWTAAFLRQSTAYVPRSSAEFTTVRSAQFSPSVIAVGTVAAESSVILATREAGVVKAVHRKNGDYVNAGDLIVELSNASLSRAVLQDVSSLSQQLSELFAAEVQMANSEADARSRAEDAEFATSAALRTLNRVEKLFERDFSSRSALDEARANYTRLGRADAEAKNRLDRLSAQNSARQSQIDQARARIEGLLRMSQSRLGLLQVVATEAGVLSDLNVEVGAAVREGEQLATIDDVSRLKVLASVPDVAKGSLRQGTTGELEGIAGGDIIVTRVEPRIRDGNIVAELAFRGSPPEGVQPGQSVTVRLITGQPRTALVADFGDLVGPDTVYRLKADRKTAVATAVTLGDRSGNEVSFRSGVKAGDQLITQVNGDLKRNSPDRIVLK